MYENDGEITKMDVYNYDWNDGSFVHGSGPVPIGNSTTGETVSKNFLENFPYITFF